MFYLSAPLDALLANAGLSAFDLNHAFDIGARRGKSAMDHYSKIPMLLTRSNKTVVTHLRRRNRYILMTAEFKGARYVEERRDSCWMICPGHIPNQAWPQTKGNPLGHIVSIGPGYRSYEQLVIREPFEAWPGTVGFNLKPIWHRYGWGPTTYNKGSL